ncbi:MAG: hypothetical protein ABJM36_00020 [Algibacter sp.]|uniref:hypothetical protein n=1 Tax=Algibacter sp. TaxID=1872428 RepID=UPI00329796B7
MDNNTLKILKSFIIKIAVIAISLCYVFGPSHHVVSQLLHSLSHGIESSRLFLTHSSHHHHNHHTHTETEKTEVHSHEIIEVIDKVLEGSNSENDSKKSEIVNFKLDKHLEVNTNFRIQNLDWSLKAQSVFIFKVQNVHKGYINSLIEPPQFV